MPNMNVVIEKEVYLGMCQTYMVEFYAEMVKLKKFIYLRKKLSPSCLTGY